MAVQWDATWNSSQSRKYTVNNAMDRIEKMLTKAYLSVIAASREEGARAIYIDIFQDRSLTYLRDVTGVVQKMYNRVTKTTEIITMSYVPSEVEFNNLGVGNLPSGASFRDVEAFVTQLNTAPSTPVIVYIGPAFFTGDVYLPKSIDQRSGTGTILHELSHAVCGTADHAYYWERTYQNVGPCERAKNADTYRAYCQSFDVQ